MDGKSEAPLQKKKRRKLTLKQAKLVKALPVSSSVAEAGRIAGFSDRKAAHTALKAIQERMPDVMDRLGLTDEFLVDKCLRPGLSATKIERSFFMGSKQEEFEDPDYSNRRAYLDMAFKLKGSYGEAHRDGDSGNQPTGITIRLELSPSDDQAQIAAVIAARRGGGGLPPVVANGDPNAR